MLKKFMTFVFIASTSASIGVIVLLILTFLYPDNAAKAVEIVRGFLP